MKYIAAILCVVLLFGCAATTSVDDYAPILSGDEQAAQAIFDATKENHVVTSVSVKDAEGVGKEVYIFAKPEAPEQCDDIIISAVSGSVSVLGEENIGDMTVAFVDNEGEPLYIFVKATPGSIEPLGKYGRLLIYVGREDVLPIDSPSFLEVFFAPAPQTDETGAIVLPSDAIEKGLQTFVEDSTDECRYEYFPDGKIITVYITTTYEGDVKAHNENKEFVDLMDKIAHLSFEAIALDINLELLKHGISLEPPDQASGYYGEIFDTHDGTINFLSANGEPIASYMLLRTTHDVMAFYGE